jgi:hypothetical protein
MALSKKLAAEFIKTRKKPRRFRAGMDSAAAIAAFSMSAGTSK